MITVCVRGTMAARVARIAAVALACAAVAAGKASVKKDGSVLVGTEDNFDEILEDNTFVLVEFYAPWCGHCKALAPEYAAAADTLADKGSPVKLMKVDVTEEEGLAQRFQIDGYPTIRWFSGGDNPSIDYSGGRTAADIVQWVTKKSGPNPIPITSVEQADESQGDPVAIFGNFESLESAEAQAYNSIALKSELVYYVVTDKSVAAHLKLPAAPSVVVKTDFAEDAVYDGEWETEALHEFCTGRSLPLVIPFSDQNAAKIFDGPIRSHVLLFAKKSADNYDAMIKELEESAAENRGKLLFITIDADDDNHGRILEFFGIQSTDLPTVRIIKTDDGMKKFAPAPGTAITAANINIFVSGFLSGALKPNLKSQKTPEDWDAKPVKVLTTNNFDEVAFDDEKHVLVEFYAPWCGHCKQLAPIYDELGAAYEHDDSVVIAKMDATENELADITVESFPTIHFFPKGGKGDKGKPFKEYAGDRDLSSFLKYLADETGVAGRPREGAAQRAAAPEEDEELENVVDLGDVSAPEGGSGAHEEL